MIISGRNKKKYWYQIWTPINTLYMDQATIWVRRVSFIAKLLVFKELNGCHYDSDYILWIIPTHNNWRTLQPMLAFYLTHYIICIIKSVHFKITVTRSSFCSKSWSISTEIKTKSADVLLTMIIILNRNRMVLLCSKNERTLE